ncbi:MAG: bifunctional (p)ppGpp synthetase/guanosine-3',5'-bis(diphosphate) 3'-pyrophosphohydrolase [Candidatus Marinimicrobia bacterium]|jgi:GTP pyrophosphokinase|nr:bifunctional (p)ppGpp synthetase/guanosine-3',5'-bis(diphosphate) 3'-pyrophosphohydrolase [Candidatus Neomarinimicrobiota bacterium]
MANALSRLIPQIVGDYPKSFTTLFNKIPISASFSEDEIKQILWRAYEFGKSCHSGQKRLSGKPYFSEHCVSVANILADWKMDHNTIIGGLLHDTVEDSDISIDQIKKQFGEDVAQMVDGVTKLGHIEFSSRQDKQAGNFMKLLLSVAQDLRVVMIKFADRLHNMKTLHYMSRLKQHRIARETRDVYIPLAHRLGMASVKWELEDMVMETLHPKKHKEIKSKLKATKKQRAKVINQVINPIQKELKEFDLNAEIFGRPKSVFSIFGKMINRDKTFEEIYDLYAIRVLVDELEQCYLILGLIHQLYSPVQERFKDFIATPKSNGYQSIHTTVIGPHGNMVEIQIRTRKMDKTAEIGVAAHWRYKEGKNTSTDLDKNVKWLRELTDILQSETADPNEFMHLLKIDLFDDEIFVFTPKGDLVQLPKNATIIDFAFQIHTQVGLHCLGSKINHKVVPLNTVLKNGDRVEILTSSTQKPSYGWLKFVVTSKARTHINRYLKSIRREECIHIGTEILEKSLRRNKLSSLLKKVQKSHSDFGYKSKDDLMEAIGNGKITVKQIIRKMRPKNEIEVSDEEFESNRKFIEDARSKTGGIKLQGITDLMVHFGKCCNPIPGDEMVGFITRGRGITVHQSSCKSLPLLQEESDRLVPVEWNVGRKDFFNVRLKVTGVDRKGTLKELTECISGQNINITSLDLKVVHGLAKMMLIIQVRNLRQLDRIIKKASRLKGIDSIERVGR